MRRTVFLLILRIFGLAPSSININKKGLIIILIDGLSFSSLKTGIEKKYCYFFTKLLEQGYMLNDYYCGPPATTTATEAELFFGSNTNIPGFSWFDRSLMKGIRGNNAKSIELYENQLKPAVSLLKDGSCIGGVYSSGASQYSLSGKDLQANHPLNILRKLLYIFFIFLNPFRFFLTNYLIVKSLFVSIMILIRKNSKKRFYTILKDSFSRIFLGNILTYIAELELLRETPVLFIDYVLYDEFSHEYGVQNKTSLSSLRLIDWYCKSLYEVSQKAKRKYEIIFLSDHGHTPSIPFPNLQQNALVEMIKKNLNDASRNVIKTYVNFNLNDSINKYLYLVPGGSAVHLFFSETLSEPMYLDELSLKYPSFIDNLLNENTVGWVLVRKDKECQMLIGKHGAVEFKLGKMDKIIASPFKSHHIDGRIIDSLAVYAQYENNGDLVLYGNITSGGKLIAFEEHRGTHGGFYGNMNFPFVITNNAIIQNQLKKNNTMKNVFQAIRSTYSPDKL